MYFRVADWLKAIVLVAILFITYILVSTISHTILLFVIASLIVFIVNPLVGFLVSRKVNRIIAILLTYTLFFGILAILIFIFGPIVSVQIASFVQNIPGYIESLIQFADRAQEQLADIELLQQIPFEPEVLITQATEIATEQLRNIILLIPSLIAFITDLVLIFILSVYMLYFLPRIDQTIKRSLPGKANTVYNRFLVTMRTALGRYVLGQLTLMVLVGILSGIGVSLVGLPFPLLLGVWAGLTEIIPILGPILGAIPAVIIAITIDPVLALWVILIFVIVQQIESGLLSPLIFRGTAGINPLLVILGVIAGAEIAGIIGIFFAVPVLVTAITLIIFIRDNFGYERVEGGPDRIIVIRDKDRG